MTDADIADRLARRRARIIPVMVVAFIAQQAASGSWNQQPPGPVKIAAWFVMSLVLLLLLATGGGWARGPAVRALLNDESTHAHRQQAAVAGFFAAMASCVVVYAVALIKPLGGVAAVHLVMTTGIGAALMRFARLERRAFRGADE